MRSMVTLSKKVERPLRKVSPVNIYVEKVHQEFQNWIYAEDRAPSLKGRWREGAFNSSKDKALDLEIGTGNGYYFEHYALQHPDRLLLGIELKFKPLVQTIKRALLSGSENAKLIRYNASLADKLFETGELNNVFIFFPDPWEKKRQLKHRLISLEFLMTLYELQRPGSQLVFKTDSKSYYQWVLERAQKSPYKVERQSEDLHKSEWARENFMTHFEKLWTRKGRVTHYLLLSR